MATLKVLNIKEVSKKNLQFFALDSAIIQGVLSDYQLCTIYGKTSDQLAGRRTSLVIRKHISKGSRSAFVEVLSAFAKEFTEQVREEETKPKRKQRKAISDEESYNVKVDIYNGIRFKEIALKHDISLPTVYRLKKLMVDINFKPTSTNTYTNSDGLNKEIARCKMAKYIIDSDVLGIIPSLPHIACTIEKKILLEQPTQKFIGVEYDKPTCVELAKTIKNENLPISFYYGKLADKIYGQIENAYAHIIADYCGMLPTFSKEIEYAIQNKIVKVGGIIAMTFGKPIRGTDAQSEFIKSLGATITNNPNDNRCMSDKATESYFNRIIGDNFQFVEIFNYSDDKKGNGMGYPMTLVILKRIK